MKRWLPAALAGVAFAVCSCSVLTQQQQAPEETKETKKKIPPPLYLGTVHQVYPDKGFALLRIIGPIPKEGVTLITHPFDGTNARIGNLLVSSIEAAGKGIIAADIRSGTVVQGDRVYLYRDVYEPESKEQEPTEETEVPQKPDAGSDETLDSREMAPEVTEATPLLPESSSERANNPVPAPKNEPPPSAVPDHLNDIPEDIRQWDNM